MTFVYNKSDEKIPAFALMQIDDGVELRSGRMAFNVKKPAGEFRPSMFLVNGPTPIPVQTLGVASHAIEPCWCLFDSDSVPAFDDDWGPVSGSWKLGPTGTGFHVVGKEPVRERVIVQLQIGPQLFMAQVDEAVGITVPATGTFNRIDGTIKGSETEITDDAVEVYDRFGDVNDDSTAIIGYIDGGWEQVVGECP